MLLQGASLELLLRNRWDVSISMNPDGPFFSTPNVGQYFAIQVQDGRMAEWKWLGTSQRW